MSNSRQSQLNRQLTAELQDNNEEIALEAVSKIKSLGTAELIPAILERWISATGKLEQELTGLLYTLKDPKVIPVLVDALYEKKFMLYRDRIVAVFWNAGLDASPHLSDFVKLGTQGSYMESLECLTLIENLDGPFPEEELMDSLLVLKEYFGTHDAKDDKYELVRAIASLVHYSGEIQNAREDSLS